ncbi:MAG: MBG domain-containing protein, partial [Methylococcaceae bacterium]
MKPYQLHPAQILRHNALYLAIISALYPSFSAANPNGAQVISGQVSIDQSVSGVTTIKNSPNAIINWQNFNIAKNEITQFIQQNGQSAVLNRIVGGNPSEILGSLYSNGKVFLINPNGIVFGAGSQIDTQGLLASSLNLSDNDFQKGNFHFIAGSKAGDIANEGIIHAGKDGNIVLVAPNIQNNGIIKSEGGKIVLAAGQELILTSMDDPEIRFQVQAPKNHVLNVGQLLTESGSINVFAGSIKHSGDISADSVEIDKQGNIRLVAKSDVTLEKDSTISANNEKGVAGKIEVTGENVAVLDNSKIEAIGEKGGGEILVGGDYQGKNVAVQNAKITTIAENVEIKADAKNQGNGGKVIVWADDETKVAAKISAKGGKKSGDGGLVETSGHKLDVKGTKVNTTAEKGKTGNWLLDPWNITIAASSPVGDTLPTSVPYELQPTQASTILASQIEAALISSDVSISTNSGNPSIPGGDAGDIIVGAAITWASNKLTFIAEHDITINNALNGGTTGKLELNAGHLITATSAVNVGEFTLSIGAWIQNGTLPSFSATDFIISGGTFLRTLGGNGSSSPYQITDVYGLQGAKGFLSSSFVLANNIDATGTSGWNWDGDVYYNGFEPIGNSEDHFFTGTFNGQNHTINNLTITRPWEYGGIGLFSHSNGIIQNLGLTNVSISGGSIVGSIVGFNSGSVSRSYSTGAVSGTNYIGGLIGKNYSGTVSDTYSMVSVTGNEKVGGLVGAIDGTNPIIENSYSTGLVSLKENSGSTYIGGLVGYSLGYNGGQVGTITNSYWDKDTTRQPISAADVNNNSGMDLTTAQMQQSANFIGFNFANTWTITNGSSYPHLAWQGLDVRVTPPPPPAFTPMQIKITADGFSRSYGSVNPDFTGTLTEGSYLGSDTWDSLGVSFSTNANQKSEIGNYSIVPTITNGRYALTPINGTLTITPASLMITANALSKSYNTTDPALTYGTVGLLDGDTLVGGLSRTSGENVGRYPITSTLANPNYDISYLPADFVITPANLTITAHPQTKIYGTNDPSLTYVSQGLLGNDTLSGNLTRTTGENVGRYTITQGDLHNPNYTLSYIGAELGISPANLTITAHPQTKIYGTSDPSLTYVSQGLLNNDTLSGNLTRTTGENVGRYTITQGDLHNPNYTLNYVGAELGISPANLTITAHPQSKTFGEVDPKLTFSIQGLVGEDKLTGELSRVAGETVKTYEITSNVSAGDNYKLSYTPNFLTINRAPKITWISQTDNQWQNAANWNQGVLPDSTQDVSIPNTNFRIDMAGTIHVNSLFSLASLHLVDGASVNVTNPFTLQIETILSGKGTFITPEFINNGTISTGDSPGIIAITGDFIQTESGLLKMEIQDETPSGYDQLNISGDATLNGTIKLISLNGYKPSPNFQPKFLSARRFSGGFSRIDNSEG